MEEKVYSRSVTKQAMSGRVVDKRQIDRHYRVDELSELYVLTKTNYKERPSLPMPSDEVLKFLYHHYPRQVFKYHDHERLLENKPEQDLNEEEIKEAWQLYEDESKGRITRAPILNGNLAALNSNDPFRTDGLNYINAASALDSTGLLGQYYPPSFYPNDFLQNLLYDYTGAFRHVTAPTTTNLAPTTSTNTTMLRNQLNNNLNPFFGPLSQPFNFTGPVAGSSKAQNPPRRQVNSNNSRKSPSSNVQQLITLQQRHNGNFTRPSDSLVAKNSSENVVLLPDDNVLPSTSKGSLKAYTERSAAATNNGVIKRTVDAGIAATKTSQSGLSTVVTAKKSTVMNPSTSAQKSLLGTTYDNPGLRAKPIEKGSIKDLSMSGQRVQREISSASLIAGTKRSNMPLNLNTTKSPGGSLQRDEVVPKIPIQYQKSLSTSSSISVLPPLTSKPSVLYQHKNASPIGKPGSSAPTLSPAIIQRKAIPAPIPFIQPRGPIISNVSSASSPQKKTTPVNTPSPVRRVPSIQPRNGPASTAQVKVVHHPSKATNSQQTLVKATNLVQSPSNVLLVNKPLQPTRSPIAVKNVISIDPLGAAQKQGPSKALPYQNFTAQTKKSGVQIASKDVLTAKPSQPMTNQEIINKFSSQGQLKKAPQINYKIVPKGAVMNRQPPTLAKPNSVSITKIPPTSTASSSSSSGIQITKTFTPTSSKIIPKMMPTVSTAVNMPQNNMQRVVIAPKRPIEVNLISFKFLFRCFTNFSTCSTSNHRRI